MKKIFLKACLFLLMIIVPFAYLNYRYKNTNYYKRLNDRYKFLEIPEDIQIVNLGNSHAQYGILYSGNTDLKGHNFALFSQPFEYDYYILDYYVDYLDKDATVIVPVSYYDWYYNYETLFTEGQTVYNERYYSFLDKEHIMNYELKKDILYNKFSVLTAGENIRYIFEDVPPPEPRVSYKKVENVVEIADQKYKTWMESVMATNDLEREECKKHNKYYLKKILDFCYAKGYHPVLVTMPMTNELYSRFSEEFKEDFYQNCEEILEDYPELLYFDYANEKGISDNLDYFEDCDHMNTNGANTFSRKLFSDLEGAGLLSYNN